MHIIDEEYRLQVAMEIERTRGKEDADAFLEAQAEMDAAVVVAEPQSEEAKEEATMQVTTYTQEEALTHAIGLHASSFKFRAVYLHRRADGAGFYIVTFVDRHWTHELLMSQAKGVTLGGVFKLLDPSIGKADGNVIRPGVTPAGKRDPNTYMSDAVYAMVTAWQKSPDIALMVAAELAKLSNSFKQKEAAPPVSAANAMSKLLNLPGETGEAGGDQTTI